MASPSINWDDIRNQALLVQDLLLHPENAADSPTLKSKMAGPEASPQLMPKIGMSEDSPLLITKIAVPQELLLLSPDTLLDGEKAETLALASVKKVNGCKHKDSEVKTPLKDCTNTSHRDPKILNATMMVTPEVCKRSEESSKVFCPSSAEFKKFLSDIMEVSPVMKDDSFEDPEKDAVTKCESSVTTELMNDLPVVKALTRSRTYDLIPSDPLIDTDEKPEAVKLSSVKKISEINGYKQKDSEVKTPLKDCINTSQRDTKGLKDSKMVTPEMSKSSEESSRVPCPFSAEFKEFLSDITEVLPVVKNCDLEALEEVVKQCQTMVVKESTKDLPVAKVRARRGTYDLVSPDTSTDASEKEKTLVVSPIKTVNEIIEEEQKDSMIKFRSRSGTFDLASPSCDLSGLSDLESESSLQAVGISTKSNSELMLSESNTSSKSKNVICDEDTILSDCITSKVENVKLLAKEDECTELGLEKNTSCSTDNSIQTQQDSIKIQNKLLVTSGSDLNADTLKLCKRQLSKKSSLQRPHSGFSSAKDENNSRAETLQTPALEIIDTDSTSCSQEESTIGKESVVSEATDLDKGNTVPKTAVNLQEKTELAFVNVSDDSLKIQLNEVRCLSQNICSLDNILAENQKTLGTSSRLEPALKRRASAQSNLAGKASVKTDTGASSALPKKAPLTKLPQMKPGQSKLTLKRPSTGFTNSKPHTASSTDTSGQETKGEDSVILPKTNMKQQGQRESRGASKLPSKLLLRPPSKTSEQSQGSLKIEQVPNNLRINTKVSEQEDIKIKQIQDKQVHNPLKKSDASKPVTNLTKRLSVMTSSNATSNVAKDTTSVIKPPMPVTDASRTVTKESVKVLKKAVVQAGGSGKVSNKASPLKALFPVNGSKTVTLEDQPANSRTVVKGASPLKALFLVNGSRTVTLEDQPANSRTVVKEAQPVGSRTVTKASGGQPSDVFVNNLGTPMIGDKFLAPRRLSNAFHSPSKLSGSLRDRDKKHNSSIPTPTRFNRHSSQSSEGSTRSNSSFQKSSLESPFPGTGSRDYSEIFKVYS